MGGSSPTSTTTTSKTELPAWLNWHSDRALTGVRQAAETPYQPYAGPVVAGLTPEQMQAFGMAAQGSGAQGYLDQAAGLYNSANSTAARVANAQAPLGQAFTATSVGGFPGADLSKYLNPYTQNVIDTSLGALDRTRQQSIASNAAQATAAGAFGGSRSAVLDSLTNEAALRESGQLAAGLNQANFSQAQQAVMADLAREQQNAQFNAGQQQSASFNNANLAAGQLDRALGAAGTIGQTGQAYGQLGALRSGVFGDDFNRLLTAGNQAQDDTQFAYDRAYQEFLRGQEDPLNKALAYAGAVGGAPHGQTGTVSQPLTRNRTASALGGAASGAAMGSAFGPWGTAIGALAGGAYGYFG